MDTVNILIGLLGLILGLVSCYFTYISFINPITRFKMLLKKPENWERLLGVENHISIYRHKKFPNFQIIIDWNNPAVEGFKEEWIMNYPFRDIDNAVSYYVQLTSNGMLLQRELFLSLDGHRYFVPVPRHQGEIQDQRLFYYENLQINLAKVIGKFDFYKDIYEFTAKQNNLGISEL